MPAATGILMHKKQDGADKENSLLHILQKYRWLTKVQSLLRDDFELEDDYAAGNITIEDALSHRSGLAGADLIYGNWMGPETKGVVRALRYLGPLDRLFRTTWQYNNLMYSVMGEILEKITGLKWGAISEKLIWEPLKMRSTFFKMEDIPEAQRQDLARGYYWVDGQFEAAKADGYYVTEPYIDFAGLAPAGAVVSTVLDYGEWVKELLGAAAQERNPSHGKSVLTSELFTELTTPRILMPPLLEGKQNQHLNLAAYGLGWMIDSSVGHVDHPIVHHSGSLNGFGTQIFLLPNDDFGIVCVSNTQRSKSIGEFVSLERIATRLELSDDARTKIVDRSKAALSPLSGEKVPGSFGGSDSDSRDDTDMLIHMVELCPLDEFMEDLRGDYSHPAYGTYRVSLYNIAKADRVIYAPSVPLSERENRDRRRTEEPCLLVSLLATAHGSSRSCFMIQLI